VDKDMWQILKRALRQICPDNLFYDLRKYYIRNKLEKGMYDNNEKEMNILKYLVKPGHVALDLGANIGSYTRLLSKLVDQNGTVHAFEAMPSTYGYLVFNMKQNLYNNVVTYNVAVGDKLGLCVLIFPNAGMKSIYRAGLKQHEYVSGKEFTVPMSTLDSFYPHCFNKVDFIKCDVEGAELLVFRGAKQVLLETRPKIICEISNGSGMLGTSEAEIFKLFQHHGYQPFFYDGRKLVLCKAKDNRNKNANYIFFHIEDPEGDLIIKNIESNFQSS
jgi:FkbM family methyltransferase